MGFYGFLNAEKDAKVGQFGIFLVFWSCWVIFFGVQKKAAGPAFWSLPQALT